MNHDSVPAGFSLGRFLEGAYALSKAAALGMPIPILFGLYIYLGGKAAADSHPLQLLLILCATWALGVVGWATTVRLLGRHAEGKERQTFFGLLALLLAFSASAQAQESSIKNIRISSTLKSEYLSGKGAILSKEPVVQTDALVSFRNGLYADLFHSAGIKTGPNGSFADEADLYAGWAGEIGKSGFSADAGAGYINLFPLERLGGFDIFEFYGQLSAPSISFGAQNLTPYARIETLRSADRTLANWQPLYYLGLRHHAQLGETWALEEGGYINRNPGILGLKPGVIAMYQGQLDWKLTKHVTFNPVVLQQSVPIEVYDGRRPETVLGVGLTLNF